MPERGTDLPDTYRVWTWWNDADPRELRLEHRPLPMPDAGEVLVRNAVIGLNPVDWKILDGRVASWAPGHVPGVDGSGMVVATGANVPRDWLGRRVAYHQDLRGHGSFAEYTPLAARALLGIPERVDTGDAAAFPCAALTAWLALEKLPASAGHPLLVAGAGGSVGHWLVQLAAWRDWRVTAMCHPRHWDRLRALGAEACLPGPLPADVNLVVTQAGRFLAAIDLVSAEHAGKLVPALLANGHLVCVQDRVAAWPTAPFSQALSLHEVALGALHQYGDDADWERLMATGTDLLAALGEGELRAEPHVVRPFADLPSALKALQHRNFSGKSLVRL